MSLLPTGTNANTNLYYFIRGDGQLLNVSTLNANTISTNTLTASTISTTQLFTDTGTISSFSTFQIDLNSQLLTATPSELLLNGVPIATTSNLSSLADWSLDPAISTVQMGGNDLNAAGTISTTNIRGGNAFFTNLIAYNSLFVSTATSTISSMITTADLGVFSTVSTGLTQCAALNAQYYVAAQEGDFNTIRVPGNIGLLLLDNGGPQFGASAEIRMDWFQQGPTQTSLFYDTTISSVRFMTHTASGYTDNPASRLYVPEARTSSLYVSSINGAEFNSTTINVDLGSFSTVAATSISSLGAEIRQALISSIVFSPSLNPSLGGVNVNMGLGGILGNVIGWGAGVFGAAAGLVGLVTGVTALATGRQTQNINNNVYETINGNTQLQISTLGTPFSTIYRLNDSIDPQAVPGQEIFVSTISPPGPAIRSLSDPLYTLSTPQSTIQSFGQWVPLPQQTIPSSISSLNEWAFFPALSTINFATGVPAVISAATPATDNIALVGSNIQLVGGHTDAKDLLLVSTLSTATIAGAADNLFGLGVPGLKIDAANLFLSTPQVIHPGLFNGSTIGVNSGYSKGSWDCSTLTFSTATGVTLETSSLLSRSITTSSLTFAQTGAFGLSSILFVSTSALPGIGTSSCLVANTDFSVGQNDIYAQQIRLGYLNPSSQPSEIIFHSPNNTQRAFNLGNTDQTIRIQSTTNATTAGYLLDTQVNPPFFSTINQSTSMMAWFPSTTSGTIGVSTISFIPPKIVAGAFTSLSTQALTANTPLALWLEQTDYSKGGIATSTNAIVIPSAGVFEIIPSIQFEHPLGAATADFWLRKGGVDIPNTCSEVYLPTGGNGQTLGVTSFIVPCAAGDKLQLMVASPDSGVTVAFIQSTISPYAKPANPSVVVAIKCLNY